MKAAVVTVSDRCSRGEAEDLSGPALAEMLERHGWTVETRHVVPDDVKTIQRVVAESAVAGCGLVVTTGGTGLAPRDVTPEAVRPLLEKEIPGLAELMRLRGLEKTPYAPLSRSLAGLYRSQLVLCLPGSKNGACDSLQAVLPILPHALEIAAGQASSHRYPGEADVE